jgi:hypothetical protein
MARIGERDDDKTFGRYAAPPADRDLTGGRDHPPDAGGAGSGWLRHLSRDLGIAPDRFGVGLRELAALGAVDRPSTGKRAGRAVRWGEQLGSSGSLPTALNCVQRL